MDDEFDDDWFDNEVLDAIDQQESQYISTQQAPRPITISTQANNIPFKQSTTQQPVLLVNNGQYDRQQQQQQQQQQYDQTEQIIDNLKFTVDRLQSKLAQEENAREVLHNELEQARSEYRTLQSVNEGVQFELMSLRRFRHDNNSGGGAIGGNEAVGGTSDHGVGSTRALSPSGKKSIFPNESGFSDPMYNKYRTHTRARSTTPSPASPSTATTKRKRTAEAMTTEKPSTAETTMTSTELTPTSNTKKESKTTIPTVLEFKPLVYDNKGYDKLLHLLLVPEYNKLQQEQRNMISNNPKLWPTILMDKLRTRFASYFNPPQYQNQKLTMLAIDISDCIARAADIDITIILQQLMNIFGHILSISIKGEMFDVISKTVEVICLLTCYKEVADYLLREFKRVEEGSILWNLSVCLNMFDVLLPDDVLQLSKHIPANVSDMSTKDLNYLLITYKVSSKKLESLIQRVLLYKTSHISTIRIIEIYLQLIEMTDGFISQSFQFLLKQPAFFNLLSTNCPLNIIIKTLNLLNELVKCDDITKFLSMIKINQESTVSTVSELSSLLLMQQPSRDPDDIENWFRLRHKVVYLLKRIFNSTSIPELLLHQTCVQVLTPLQVMMYNECARVKDLDQKPFPAKRFEMIEELINACLELIYSILKCYGTTQRLDDDQYIKLVHRMEFARNTYDKNSIRSSSIKYNEISKIMDLLKMMHGGLQHGSDNNTMGTK